MLRQQQKCYMHNKCLKIVGMNKMCALFSYNAALVRYGSSC